MSLPNAQVSRSASAFEIADPMARFAEVNKPHARRAQSNPLGLTLSPRGAGGAGAGRVAVIDLHYQSVRTARVVLDEMLPAALASHAEVWVITGTGHHVAKRTHQKSSERGVLFDSVKEYLAECAATYRIGKDWSGRAGAFLVLPGR